jgi:hypothetical protein
MELYLKPDEAKFLSMAVVALIEELNSTSKNVNLNWNPETRKDLKDMIAAGSSLKVKLNKLGFDMRELPPYIDGEEKDYLTKES